MTQQANDYSPADALAYFKARSETLQQFIRDHMTEGTDYGAIPGTQGGLTLFKPGAEKLCIYLGLSPLVEVTQRIEDWDKGFVAYEVKVTLMNRRSSVIEAEGAGSCNSRERKYKNQDAANVANTILKMAKKRAFIDAALAASGAGEMFADEDEDATERAPNTQQGASGNPANKPANTRPASNAPRGEYAATPNAPPSDATQGQAIATMAQQLWPADWQAQLLKITGGIHVAHLDRPAANKLIAHLRSVAATLGARRAA